MKRIVIAAMLLALALILLPAQAARAEERPGPPCDECGGPTIVISDSSDHHYIMCKNLSCSMRFQLVSQRHEGGTATCVSRPICTYCGEEYGEKDPGHHDWGNWMYKNSQTHICTCKNGCGASMVGFHYGGTATCIVQAVCEVCKQSYRYDSENHVGPITPANCADGAICSACQHIISPPDPDNHRADFVVPATCISGAYCHFCHTYFGETDPDKHKGPIQSVGRIEPTCTAVGHEAGKRCAACGAYTQGGGEIPVDPDAHTPGEPVRENALVPIGLYYEVVYCTDCGQEMSREAHIDLNEARPAEDAFARFSRMIAERVQAAEANGVVEMDAGDWIGLQRSVFEAMADRPDVTLKMNCLVDGETTELTIPAGFDLLTPLGNGWMLTFEEIVKLIG